MKKEFKYELKTPIKIAVSGKQEEASSIIVKGPRPSDKVDAMTLESIVQQSVLKACVMANKGSDLSEEAQKNALRKKEEKIETDDEKADSLVDFLLMGTDGKDIQALTHILRELICEGNTEQPQATINGQKFVKPIFDDIGLIDFKALLGRYVYHFLSSTLT